MELNKNHTIKTIEHSSSKHKFDDDKSNRKKSNHIVVMEENQKLSHYLSSFVGSKLDEAGYNFNSSLAFKSPESKRRANNNINNQEVPITGLYEKILIYLTYIFVVITFPITIWRCIVIVYEYQRIVIFRLGHLYKYNSSSSGVYFILPWVDYCVIVDMRTVSLNVQSQEVSFLSIFN